MSSTTPRRGRTTSATTCTGPCFLSPAPTPLRATGTSGSTSSTACSVRVYRRELALYLGFFFPGVIALIYAGTRYASESWRYHEVSVFSPADIPIFPLKTLIPSGGVLLFIQGLAEMTRCIVCLREGQWPQRQQDVEELETAILHEREALSKREELSDTGAKA